MLECILIAGALYFHAAESEERGVRFATSWEFVLPVADTSMTASTDLLGDDNAEGKEHGIRFHRPGESYTIYLKRTQWPDFSMVAFMKTCPSS